MPKNYAVLLCGCGAMDGSEIHEATFALSAIDEYSAQYQCFALDEPQKRVMNFLENKEESESRIQIKEAARIARGNIKQINECKVEEFDGLVIPGGFGVAFNFCDFATSGANATVHTEISKLILEFNKNNKPITAICISPVLIALTLGKTLNPEITAGPADSSTAEIYNSLGARSLKCATENCIVDKKNKIISTPAYMQPTTVSQVRKGIYKAIEASFSL